jgi:hypothetical protein
MRGHAWPSHQLYLCCSHVDPFAMAHVALHTGSRPEISGIALAMPTLLHSVLSDS